MANELPLALASCGTASGRIVPVNYTPQAGSYCMVLGSDLPGCSEEMKLGDIIGFKQSIDLTSINSLSFAVKFRNTQAESAGARRGLLANYPFTLATAGALYVRVDGGAPQNLVIPVGTYTLAQVAAVLDAAIVGATITADSGQLKITSDTTGSSSSIQITGGATMATLGHSAGTTTGETRTFRLRVHLASITILMVLQPAVGADVTYAKRTVNTKAYSGSLDVKWRLEVV